MIRAKDSDVKNGTKTYTKELTDGTEFRAAVESLGFVYEEVSK